MHCLTRQSRKAVNHALHQIVALFLHDSRRAMNTKETLNSVKYSAAEFASCVKYRANAPDKTIYDTSNNIRYCSSKARDNFRNCCYNLPE